MVMILIITLIAAAVLAMVAVTGMMVANAFRNNIITEEISMESLPLEFDGYRILFITDIHRRTLPSALLSPLRGTVDAVFVGGDLTEKNSPLRRLNNNMKLLSSIAPTYVVHGNHDYHANITRVDQIVRDSGVRLLMDENVAIEREGCILWLTGVDFPKRTSILAYPPLPVLPASHAGSFRIILVHDPLWLSQRRSVPADLVLAGHTHGGQVVLPFIKPRHVEDFYRKYNAGMFQWPRGDASKGFAKVLISRGFGTAHMPLRWGSPAEMHILTLRKGLHKQVK